MALGTGWSAALGSALWGRDSGTVPAQHACTVFAGPSVSAGGDLTRALRHHRPTIFFGVPRVWEKMAAVVSIQLSGLAEEEAVVGEQEHAVVERLSQSSEPAPGAKGSWIHDWAVRTASTAHREGQAGGYHGWRPLFYPAASAILRATVAANLGLDQAMHLYCGRCGGGEAAISPALLEYFGGLDMHILQVYGACEGSGGATLCSASIPDHCAVGAVGRALPGVEIKVDHRHGRESVGEGEVCVRGRNRMMGYLNDPEATAAATDAAGYFHTGDVGSIDRYGLLTITGKLKPGGQAAAPAATAAEAPAGLVRFGG